MRLALAVCSLALLVALPADAQRRDRDRDHDGGDGFAEKGDAALTFSIDGLVLAPTEGGVGARLWVADRTAVGASLGFGYSRMSGRFGSDVEGFTSHVAFAVEQHVGRGRRVSPFVGGAVRFGYAAFEGDGGVIVYEDDTPDPPGCDTRDCPDIPYPDPYYYDSSVTEVSIGGGLLLGAEVKLIDRLSLSAAHTVGLTYTRGDGGYGYDYFPTEPPTCDGCEGGGDDVGFGGDGNYDRFEVGTGTTSLTLSIYF